MGQKFSMSRAKTVIIEEIQNPTLDDFAILRNIGKGSFGKVCIVRKRNSERLFAMKYMDRQKCSEEQTCENVIREVKILMTLDHPFLVNLWYSFYDDEYLYTVFELFLGGDLRYHLSQNGPFTMTQVKFYLVELFLALDYLRHRRIIHRDIKPDNVLLDDFGHIHLTDFNIATILTEKSLATSASGTRPYMAPEIFATKLGLLTGYDYAADYWSLGVCCYEMLAGKRPYAISANTEIDDAYTVIKTCKVPLPMGLDKESTNLMIGLLSIDSTKRLQHLSQLQKVLPKMNFASMLRKRVAAPFLPSKNEMNCDPTFELEETIMECNPLQKKQRRPSTTYGFLPSAAGGSVGSDTRKLSTLSEGLQTLSPMGKIAAPTSENDLKDFVVFNREKLLLDELKRIQELEEELGLRPSNVRTEKKDKLSKLLGRPE